MSADISLVVTATTGGAAGSLMALLIGYLRDKRKENMLRTRARAVVKHELQIVRDFVQHKILDPATQARDYIQILDQSAEVKSIDRIIESVQYPAMNTEIKLIAFEPDLQRELQDIYLKIKSMHVFRKYTFALHQGTKSKFVEYGRSYLMNLVEDIDKVIQKIDTA